jgi:hypothetical protein
MRAPEMVQAVYDTELELKKLLNDIVSQKINELSDSTGLDLISVHINFLEVTNINSTSKQFVVGNVGIHSALPDPIFTEVITRRTRSLK